MTSRKLNTDFRDLEVATLFSLGKKEDLKAHSGSSLHLLAAVAAAAAPDKECCCSAVPTVHLLQHVGAPLLPQHLSPQMSWLQRQPSSAPHPHHRHHPSSQRGKAGAGGVTLGERSPEQTSTLPEPASP